MRWVTWENIGVDRMGSAWLIRRFIDPEATFGFIAMGSPPPEEAKAFDIPGARFSHHHGHCTFHTLLEQFKLADAVLRRIARMIDEADVVQEASLEPAAAGLDLICRGLRRVSQSDSEALGRGFVIYDALYAQLIAEAMEGA